MVLFSVMTLTDFPRLGKMEKQLEDNIHVKTSNTCAVYSINYLKGMYPTQHGHQLVDDI
jgi:hypothetical protein